jgi:hypothetical protein
MLLASQTTDKTADFEYTILDKYEQLGTDPFLTISPPFAPKSTQKNSTPTASQNLLFDIEIGRTETVLRKRANAKFFASKLSNELVKIDESILQHAYQRSVTCNQMLVQCGKTLETRYCGTRWCNVCNRIRTSKLISGYEPVLKEMKDKYFVTLTLPNCQNWELVNIIQFMLTTSRRVQDTIKKQKQRKKIDYQLVGMRKMECTYNATADTYHPHFHYIIEGKEASHALLEAWLAALPQANRAAQDVRPAELNSEKELFKYFSKFVSKTGKGDNVVVVRALDNIFSSIVNRRVFQPIGIKKFINVEESMPEVRGMWYDDLPYVDGIKHWNWNGENWKDEDQNSLCEYRPSNAQKRFINHAYI